MIWSVNSVCFVLCQGVPGRMCDANACTMVAEDEWDNSMLVDDGYPHRTDRRMVGPDQTYEHTSQRSPIERLFGNTKNNSKVVGGYYMRNRNYHDLFIRSAFILENLRRIFGPRH